MVPSTTAVVYQASFGITFTVVPQVGLAWTGISHPPPIADAVFGWSSAVYVITPRGVSIGVIPKSELSLIKFKYFATQGDRLQAFFLQIQIASTDTTMDFPFDYNRLVKFDP